MKHPALDPPKYSWECELPGSEPIIALADELVVWASVVSMFRWAGFIITLGVTRVTECACICCWWLFRRGSSTMN